MGSTHLVFVSTVFSRQYIVCFASVMGDCNWLVFPLMLICISLQGCSRYNSGETDFGSGNMLVLNSFCMIGC